MRLKLFFPGANKDPWPSRSAAASRSRNYSTLIARRRAKFVYRRDTAPCKYIESPGTPLHSTSDKRLQKRWRMPMGALLPCASTIVAWCMLYKFVSIPRYGVMCSLDERCSVAGNPRMGQSDSPNEPRQRRLSSQDHNGLRGRIDSEEFLLRRRRGSSASQDEPTTPLSPLMLEIARIEKSAVHCRLRSAQT